MPGDSVLRGELRALGRADGITSVRRLAGGVIADAWLVTYADGTRVAGKTLAGAPAEVFRTEAEGLAVAHFGDQALSTIAQIRRTLTPFY